MTRIDWRENAMKFFKKRAPFDIPIILIGPGGDPDVKQLENYLERMNLDYEEIDTREQPLPEAFKWEDQPIAVVAGDPYLKAKPQELAQAVGLALRHYGFDEAGERTSRTP
jgi:hypothetical protein